MSSAIGSCICCTAISLLGLWLLYGVKRGDSSSSSSSEGSIRISLHHRRRRRRAVHSLWGEESAVPYSVATRDEDLDDSDSRCSDDQCSTVDDDDNY